MWRLWLFLGGGGAGGAAGADPSVFAGRFQQLRVGERALHAPRGSALPARTVGLAFRTDGQVTYTVASDGAPVSADVARGTVLRAPVREIVWGPTTAYVEAVVRDRAYDGGSEFT